MQFGARVGQVVLVELGDEALTGVVTDVASDVVVLDLTTAALPPDDTDVLASVFAPEALYRARATAHLVDGSSIRLDRIHDVETVQRRRWPRRPLSVPISLLAVDGPSPAAAVGETIDLGVGGTHVRTSSALPAGVDPLATLTLPDGDVIILPTRVVFAHAEADGFEYRLAFQDIDPDDAARLSKLLSA
jgi:hypothetical protein